MTKVVLNDLTNISGQETSAINTINSNSLAIETAIENTLSRDGTSPNQMEADLDLNDNDLLNVGNIDVTSLSIDGVPLTTELLAKGDTGDAATIAVGTVTTGAAGSSVIITNIGTTSAAVLDFTIPKGDQGVSGAGTGDMLAANNLSEVNAATAFSTIKQAATTVATGVVELATDAETQALTDTTRTVTPSNLATLIATETTIGLVELATTTEAAAGVDTTRAVTAAGVASALASQNIALLASGAMSGSTVSIDFASYSTYRHFQFIFDSVTAASGFNQLFLAMGAGGIDTGGSDYGYRREDGLFNASSYGTGNQTGASEIAISRSGSLGTASFELTLYNPLDAAQRTLVKCSLIGNSSLNVGTFAETWGMRNSSKTISRIRLRYDGANISAGNYRLYGYK